MPFCASCGSSVEGKFCPKCGAAVSSTTQPAAGAPAPASQPASAAPMDDNVASALCYVLGFITGIIFLVMEPYNKNRTVRFHAFQSIFASVAVFLVFAVLNIFFGSFYLGYGWFGFYGLYQLIRLACFVLWIWMTVAAFQGSKVVLPVIGQLAQKQAQG